MTIIWAFPLAGRIQIGPDRGFGILKKAFRTSYVSSLYEVGSVVETSSSIGFNNTQLVETHDGKVIFPIYDWSTSERFHLGIVYYKAFVPSEEHTVR